MTLRVPRRSAARIIRVTQCVLFSGAFVLLGYCAWVMTDAWRFQQDAQLDLSRQLQETATAVNPPHDPPIQGMIGQGMIGRLDVARLGLSVMVMEGTTARTLRHAAGHVEGTAFPGQNGNIGISGHRDTFFRSLRNIRDNDIITIVTPNGHYRYRVVSTKVVDPANLAVLDSDGTEILTLITCYPFYFVGPAPNRFIVRAQRVDDSQI